MVVVPITNLSDLSPAIVPVSIPGLIASKIVTDLDHLPTLGPAWDAIEQGFPSPMQQIDWSLACLHSFQHRGKPRVLADAVDGALRGVAPLIVDRLNWPARARMTGVADLQEPMDLVYSDQESLDALTGRLADLRMPLSLERVMQDSPTIPALRRAFAGRGVIVERPRPTCPFITLSDAWKDPPGQLSSRRRSDLRRAWKRAEAYGDVTCEVTTPKLDTLDQQFDLALEIEARSWKGEAGTALVHDLIRLAFYRRYALAACRRGTLRLCWLRFGGSIVAVQIAIEDARRFWLLKIGYDEAFARCSPGNLLVCETLRYAANQGLESYEFLGSSDAWTRVWTNDERPTVCVQIYPYNLAGMAALAQQTLASLKLRWSRREW